MNIFDWVYTGLRRFVFKDSHLYGEAWSFLFSSEIFRFSDSTLGPAMFLDFILPKSGF